MARISVIVRFEVRPEKVDAFPRAWDTVVQHVGANEPDTEHYELAKDAYKFTFDDNVIWGATARVLKQLYDLLVRPS